MRKGGGQVQNPSVQYSVQYSVLFLNNPLKDNPLKDNSLKDNQTKQIILHK